MLRKLADARFLVAAWYMKFVRRLTINERVNLVFSLVALGMSSASLYFQFWYSEPRLIVSVPSYDFDAENRSYKLSLVFINSGTDPIAVSSVEPLMDYRGGGYAVLAGGLAPFVTKPGDVLLKTLNVRLTERDIVALRNPFCLPRHLFIGAKIIDKEGRFLDVFRHVMTFSLSEKAVLSNVHGESIDLLHGYERLMGDAGYAQAKAFFPPVESAQPDNCID